MTPNSGFAPGVSRWVEGLGRLRDVVRQELVATELAHRTAGRQLKVLDVGCGQGTQALYLARAGHSVAGLDISEELPDRFRAELADEPAEVRERVRLVLGPGEAATELAGGLFDVLLCHGVLMYLDDIAPILTALSHVAAPGATMSLVVRNGLAPAMRDGLRGVRQRRLHQPPRATSARSHPADLDAVLVPLGWMSDRWFGVRVVHRPPRRTRPTSRPAPGRTRRRAKAGRRDPYRSVAALLHLLYRRVDEPGPWGVTLLRER